MPETSNLVRIAPPSFWFRLAKTVLADRKGPGNVSCDATLQRQFSRVLSERLAMAPYHVRIFYVAHVLAYPEAKAATARFRCTNGPNYGNRAKVRLQKVLSSDSVPRSERFEPAGIEITALFKRELIDSSSKSSNFRYRGSLVVRCRSLLVSAVRP